MTQRFSPALLNHLRSQPTAVIHDVMAIPSAWLLAFWLRFNLEDIPGQFYQTALQDLVFIIPVQLITFYFFGLYRGIWRFASLPDLVRILKGSVVGVMLSMLLIFTATSLEGVPRSVPFTYTLLLVVLIAGPRLLYRWFKDHKLYYPATKRVMIVGSGNVGEMLARDILRNREELYRPVAFIDDNPRKLGREIHGIPIVGTSDSIIEQARDIGIDLILLALPNANSRQLRKIVEICEQTRLPFRTVPNLNNLISGHVTINELREVNIEDLLGREPVNLEWQKISEKLSGKTILITGAGGSIGSELTRQLSKINPKRLILLDHSEYNLYRIELELSQTFPDYELAIHLGDVTDLGFVQSLFRSHQIDIVFHAAAYKHVPMLETQIRQAFKNNVIGTYNTANCASEFGCDTFILVSTDKAVNPANIMGATKRVAEIYCQNLNIISDTHFITVRFGNVLGSAGSVIPLFKEQIKKGGPVTVTHPKIERYFMTIPEACQLIMQTTVIGNGGEIFVLDMGEPVKIDYLAEQMILLSGKTPRVDIQIDYIGLRPGEKLYEELFHEKEALEGTQHEKVFLAKHRIVDWQQLEKVLGEINTACETIDTVKLKELLKILVPEHTSQTSVPKPEKLLTDDHGQNKAPANKVVHINSKN